MPRFILLVVFMLSIGAQTVEAPTWGFFGHRRINRLATFTLPPDMIRFYKKHIEFITEHAVDPDKRRYATKHEAVRHYIDIDHWGSYPFPEVPRNWTDVLAKYTELQVVSQSGDTLVLTGADHMFQDAGRWWYNKGPLKDAGVTVDVGDYNRFVQRQILPNYYEDAWPLSCDSLRQLFGLSAEFDCVSAHAVDQFSGYGILPYHLLKMQRRLTDAFLEKDAEKILRLSAEFGHYLADAHVPLHTTENYNGQLTGQDGIHGFWESRIPELYADEDYDFFVGRAEYIDDPASYFWGIVLDSHQLVDSVLSIEKELSLTFPQDQQYCYEDRLGVNIRTQCPEYAAAYQARLQGTIEARMRASIHAVGSAWFTAWVDAGSPKLDFGLVSEDIPEEELKDTGNQLGRKHDN
ncbi:MAG: hypothetical protein KDC34_06130 [Saprospiraceae bacterium]|nr:hypothetical protein [Saprospiraceae bacterium]